MALTSTIKYCTNADIYDVLPDINKYHNRSRITGWKASATNFAASVAVSDTLDLYYADSTGLVQDLYWDGALISEITFPTTSKTTLDTAITLAASAINLSSTAGFGEDDIIKIDNEYLILGAADSDFAMAIGQRGILGTQAVSHVDESDVYLVVDATADLAADASESSSASFLYDTSSDKVILITDGKNPADYMIETGADYSAYITRIRIKASRMLESQLDPRM